MSDTAAAPTTEAAAGRVALVLGGTKGIGLAIALALAASGRRVAVTYRSTPPGPEVGAAGLLAVPCDVTDTASVDAAFTRVEAELGRVEVLVCNAGITNDGLLMRMKETDFTGVVDTNLTGAFRATKRATPGMMKARFGRIVYVSSVVGLLGSAGQVNYAASKAGLVGLARSVARELASRGITANVVAPGPVATDMTAVLGEARRAELTQMVPIGRFVTADEVAAAVVFLTSDIAGAVTGCVMGVDGGLGMGH